MTYKYLLETRIKEFDLLLEGVKKRHHKNNLNSIISIFF